VEEVTRLLDEPAAYEAMAKAHNPYGDGQTSARIAALVQGLTPAP
jgi:UDP-N-acetylglucosamine 2-epimerase (non-hydrolysing)